VLDDLPILLGLGARRDPFRIGHEGVPFALALGEGIPGEEIDELLVALADHGGEEARLADAVLLPHAERLGLEPLQQRRQASGNAMIDPHF
jgi:hypothetical protein